MSTYSCGSMISTTSWESLAFTLRVQSRKSLFGQCSMYQPGPSGNLHLSTIDKDSPMRAEVLLALKVVQTNMSFASADEGAAFFRAQFSDSEIAKNYEMGQTKLKYILSDMEYIHISRIACKRS